MGWLDTIRSLLDLDSDGEREETTVAVTVEKEPDASSERAVKEPVESTDEAAGGSDEQEIDEGAAEPDEQDTDETAAEPDEPATDVEASSKEEAEPTDATPGSADDAEPESDEEDEEPELDETTGDEETDVSESGRGEPLTDIEGIGSAYAQRLEEAGVDDVAALATADPEDLAGRTDVSPKRIRRWIDRATDR